MDVVFLDVRPPDFIPENKWGLWFTGLDQTISSDAIVRSFCHDTGRPHNPISSLIDVLCECPTASQREYISAFIAWYNAGFWGPFTTQNLDLEL